MEQQTKKPLLLTLSILVTAILFLTIFHAQLLNRLASTLITEDPLERVDAIVVLAGAYGRADRNRH